ncbi:MAG: DUF6514 family protein [Porcipelethomonas sp.]
MNDLSLEVISASISCDKKIVYCIFKEIISIDQDSAVTHGITATDTLITRTVRDVSTNPEEAERIISILSEKSVSPENLSEFIQDNILLN